MTTQTNETLIGEELRIQQAKDAATEIVMAEIEIGNLCFPKQERPIDADDDDEDEVNDADEAFYLHGDANFGEADADQAGNGEAERVLGEELIYDAVQVLIFRAEDANTDPAEAALLKEGYEYLNTWLSPEARVDLTAEIDDLDLIANEEDVDAVIDHVKRVVTAQRELKGLTESEGRVSSVRVAAQEALEAYWEVRRDIDEEFGIVEDRVAFAQISDAFAQMEEIKDILYRTFNCLNGAAGDVLFADPAMNRRYHLVIERVIPVVLSDQR